MISESKVKEWVGLYLAHVKKITPETHAQKEEGYKFKSVDNFQKNFNLNASDLVKMLEQSIEQTNLVAGANYFPRRTILRFANENEAVIRKFFTTLYDESMDVIERFDKAKDIIDQLQGERNRVLQETFHSWISLRFLSLLLAFRYPNKYNAVKPVEWKKFCRYINPDFNVPQKASAGEQYKMYSEHSETLRKYIMKLSTINELRKQLTNGLQFKDKEFYWMAQDIIFIVARKAKIKIKKISKRDRLNNVIVANITWNKTGWTDLYSDPRAGHRYVRGAPGHESLNFNFNKKGIDTENEIHGFVQWTNPPTRFKDGGIIIFYSKNLDDNKNQIVGIYGGARILEVRRTLKWSGFVKNRLEANIVAKKALSLRFPIYLNADRYSDKRLVPQAGFAYKGIDFAKKIILDEIMESQIAGARRDDFEKLKSIYELLFGGKYSETKEVENEDVQEQEELSLLVKKSHSREQIISDLKSVTPQTAEFVEFKGRQYKRDNKSIADLKILRDFKCQICSTSIRNKNGTLYVEAAHIVAKKHKGPETPDNIMILCPNHHKEFDLGNRTILEKTSANIRFKLNEKEYTIDLSIK